MTTSKIFASIVLLLFSISCASFGNKKPTVFVDKYNNVPADIPSQFCDRYERFITGKECKEFKKLETDEERQVFINKFWFERDPDPATPENEEKQRIDQLIDNIANEIFLNTPGGVFGLSFHANGGFRGDMAQVYLLHGEPDAMDTIEGNLFVDLMLWIYVDQQNGGVLYAFLFYQKGSIGAYSLFSQDVYKLDPCGAINEIKKGPKEFIVGGGNQGCPPDVEQIFRDIQTASGRGGVLDGYIFAWALFNFSQDGSMMQGRALGAPKPASEIAKESKSHVTGEATGLTGIAGIDYILSSCEVCNSLIPADIYLGKSFTISGPLKNFDWIVKGESAELSLKYRIILENKNGDKPIIWEDVVVMDLKKSFLDENPETTPVIQLLNPKQVASIPPGTYRVSVYVKNVTPGLMTKKYNAWSREFTK